MIQQSPIVRATSDTYPQNALTLQNRMLMRMLDEVEHGMLLVEATGRLRSCNELGRGEIDGHGPLQLVDGRVVATRRCDQVRLQAALSAALQGRRQLLSFDAEQPSESIAFSPMFDQDDPVESRVVLMVFGGKPERSQLAIDFYARAQGLTGAESTVLGQLAGGLDPQQIADANEVSITTIRSQIASIRAKTRADSIRNLLDRIALLPPIRNVARCSASPRSPMSPATGRRDQGLVNGQRAVASAVRSSAMSRPAFEAS